MCAPSGCRCLTPPAILEFIMQFVIDAGADNSIGGYTEKENPAEAR
jgi:hypothetical protein